MRFYSFYLPYIHNILCIYIIYRLSHLIPEVVNVYEYIGTIIGRSRWRPSSVFGGHFLYESDIRDRNCGRAPPPLEMVFISNKRKSFPIKMRFRLRYYRPNIINRSRFSRVWNRGGYNFARRRWKYSPRCSRISVHG